MKLGEKGSESKKRVIGGLRKTQLVTTFGSGSIVDLPNYSVIVAATDYWGYGGITIHEPNLERLLGMKRFKVPPATETESGYPAPDIPAFRFPMTHFCPGCNRLMSYKSFGDEEGRKCPACKNKEIVPSRFVAACINGHIEDFPYKWWVHKGNSISCPGKDNYDNLKIHFSSFSGGLGSIIIECTSCGLKRSMEGCMGGDALKGYRCRGHRPWIGRKKEYDDPEICVAQMRTLQRGGSNVYYSVTTSALTIPPWSGRIQTELMKHRDTLEPLFANNPTDETLKYILATTFKRFLESGFCTIEDLTVEVKRMMSDHTDDNYSEGVMMEEEYKALCIGNYNDPVFMAENSAIPAIISPYISKLVLVKRLREVLALRGFHRIQPDTPQPGDPSVAGANGNAFISLSNAQLDWLPAIELLGEGIFIRLDEEKLRVWEGRMGKRYLEMAKRLGDSNIGKGKFSARYVLLHSLSHLLIRQLTMECGYSIASIKERIYSTYPESDQSMAGILIYTSSSDSDGSLGGLVRQGQVDQFENLVRSMLQEASWCASDPICYESKGQGFDSLNYAACHACSLLPETSCEARNCLLDRVAVTGKPEDRSTGFLGKLLER